MGRIRSGCYCLASGVLLVLILPLAGATNQRPDIPDSAADEVANEVQSLADKVRQNAGETEQDANQAGDDAQAQASAAHQSVADAKHSILNEARASVGAGQALLFEVVAYAEVTVQTVKAMADQLLAKLDASQGEAQPQFEGGAGAGHAQSVPGESAVPALSLEEAGLVMAVAAVGAGGALFYLVVLQRVVLFGLVPLLSRIAHSEIYNNAARRAIADLVSAEPGLCLNDLVAKTGYSRNAVSYHLFVLEKESDLVSIKDGKYRRYFTRSGKYVNGAKNVVSALRNPTTRRMAQYVSQKPGSIQREICVLLGTTASAACWHAKRLEELHVIRKERVANTVRYFPGEALAKYDLSEFGLAAPALVVPTPIPAPASSANLSV